MQKEKMGTVRTRLVACLVVCTLFLPLNAAAEYIPNDVETGSNPDWNYLEGSTNIINAWDPTDINSFTNPGKNQIVVAVIDTGLLSDTLDYNKINDFKWLFDYTDVDFWDDVEVNLWQNPDEPKGYPGNPSMPGQEYDDDNIYGDDYCGHDFVDDDGDGTANEDPINYAPDSTPINDDNDYYISIDNIPGFQPYYKDTLKFIGYGIDVIVEDDGDTPGYLDCNPEQHSTLDNVLRDVLEYTKDPDHDGVELTPLANEDSSYPIATQYKFEGDKYPDFHGTATAGIIGAVVNNDGSKAQEAGISQISIMPLRVTSWPLFADISSILMYEEIINLADALHYARIHGADVISMQVGIPKDELDELETGSNGRFDLENTNAELEACWEAGILLIASAGNSEYEEFLYPACSEYVLSVGATMEDINYRHKPVSYYSNGNEMEVSAPGIDVKTYYGDRQGTSLSCPHVSGMAALMLSYRPELTNEEVRSILQATALPCDYKEGSAEYIGLGYNRDFWNKYGGFGECNAFYSLLYSQLLQTKWFDKNNIAYYNPQSGISVNNRPKSVIDGFGYTHIVYGPIFDPITNMYRIYYNVLTPAGRSLYSSPILVDERHWFRPTAWVDMCVDANRNAHIVWTEDDWYYGNRITIRYAEIDELGNRIVSEQIVTSRYYRSYASPFFEYLNIMCNDPTPSNPVTLYLVFNEKTWDFQSLPGRPCFDDFKVSYVKFDIFNNQVRVLDQRTLESDFDIQLSEVSADVGIKFVEGTANYIINYVWTRDCCDIVWDQFNTNTYALTGSKLLTYDLENPFFPSPTPEIRPDIDVDFYNLESYIVWVKSDSSNSIVEFTHLDANGKDGEGWIDITSGQVSAWNKIHEIGNQMPIQEGHLGINYPQISHRSVLDVRDTVNTALPRSPSAVCWVSGYSTGDYVLHFTEITYNGRELNPDADFKDADPTGSITFPISPRTNKFVSIDSGFETQLNKLFDNSGCSRMLVWDTNMNLNIISSAGIWTTPDYREDGMSPDTCTDSSGAIHYVWWSGNAIFYNKLVNNQPQFLPDITIYQQVGKMPYYPRIVFSNTPTLGQRLSFIWQVNDEALYFCQYDTSGNNIITPRILGCFNTPPPTGWRFDVAFDIAFDDREARIHVLWQGDSSSTGYILKHGSVNLDNSIYQNEATIKSSTSYIIVGSIDVGRDSYPDTVYYMNDDLYFQRLNSASSGDRCIGSPTTIHDKSIKGELAQHPNIMFDRDINRLSANSQKWSMESKNDESLHVMFMITKQNVEELHYIRLKKDGAIILPEKCIYAPDYRGLAKIYIEDLWIRPEVMMDENNFLHIVFVNQKFNDEQWYNLPTNPEKRAFYYAVCDQNGNLLIAPQILQKYQGQTGGNPFESCPQHATLGLMNNGATYSFWATIGSKIYYSYQDFV